MRASVQATAPRSPLASLTATIRGCSASRTSVSTSIGDRGARRDVVEHHRQVGAVGHRGEVPEQTGLRRPVVVRRDDQQAVDAEPLGGARLLDRVRGVVGADAGDDGGPVADGVQDDLEHGVLLAVADASATPPSSRRSTRPSCAQPVDQVRGQLLRAGEVDGAVLGQRGDHRREHAPERPGGVGGHEENLLSAVGPLPARTRSPRTGVRCDDADQPVLRRPRHPAPAVADRGRPRVAVDSASTSVTTSRSACGRKAAYTAPPPITQKTACSSSTSSTDAARPRALRRPAPGPRSGRRWCRPGSGRNRSGSDSQVRRPITTVAARGAARGTAPGPPGRRQGMPPSAPITPSRACAQIRHAVRLHRRGHTATAARIAGWWLVVAHA